MIGCLIKKTGLRKIQVLFLLSITLLSMTVTAMTVCSKLKTHYVELGKYQILKELIAKERNKKPETSVVPIVDDKQRGRNDD